MADPAADGSAQQTFDVSYVSGIQALADGQFQLVVDDRPATLHFTAGRLRQEPGAAPGAELIVRTSSKFLDRWAAGEASWDDGRARGEEAPQGPRRAAHPGRRREAVRPCRQNIPRMGRSLATGTQPDVPG